MNKRYIVILLVSVSILSLLTLSGGNRFKTNSPEFLCSKSDEKCQDNYFKNLVVEKGYKVALDSLSNLNSSKLIKGCHDRSHLIGYTSYRNKDSIQYYKLMEVCSSGYIHGYMEAAGSEKDYKAVTEFSEKVCRSDITTSRIESCIHGVGHSFYQSKLNVGNGFYSCSKIGAKFSDSSRKDKSDMQDLLTFQCISGYAMEMHLSPGRDGIVVDSTKKIEDLCKGVGNDICRIGFIRNVISNQSISLTEIEMRSNLLHSYCLALKKKYFELCEAQIGFGITSYFSTSPSGRKLQMESNILCRSKYCQLASLQLNALHGEVYSEKYIEDICQKLAYISVEECRSEIARISKDIS